MECHEFEHYDCFAALIPFSLSFSGILTKIWKAVHWKFRINWKNVVSFFKWIQLCSRHRFVVVMIKRLYLVASLVSYFFWNSLCIFLASSFNPSLFDTIHLWTRSHTSSFSYPSGFSTFAVNSHSISRNWKIWAPPRVKMRLPICFSRWVKPKLASFPSGGSELLRYANDAADAVW